MVKRDETFWNDLTSGKFAAMVKESSAGQEISDSKTLYNIVKPLYSHDADVEKAYFIFLDGKNHILSIDCMATGSLSSALIYPREIVKKILEHKAAAIIMTHNHPSGDPTPSTDDFQITKLVAIAMHAIGVTMHEHLIVGNGTHHSMADSGTILTIMDDVREAFNF